MSHTTDDLIAAVKRYKNAKERLETSQNEHALGHVSIDELGRIRTTMNDCWAEVVDILKVIR